MTSSPTPLLAAHSIPSSPLASISTPRNRRYTPFSHSPAPPTSLHERPSSKRLSSLTSLQHHLNRFRRRKSSAELCKRPSSPTAWAASNNKENIDPVTPTTVKHRRHRTSSFMENLPAVDKVKSARRTSWLPIPENTSKPLPRSLTFGELGGSTRPRKDARGVEAPSLTSIAAKEKSVRGQGSSRIPSITKSLIGRPGQQKPLSRSDTEPLLTLAPSGDGLLCSPVPKFENADGRMSGRSSSGSKLKVFKERFMEKKHAALPPLPAAPSALPLPASNRQAVARQLTPVRASPVKARIVNISKSNVPRFHTQPDLPKTPKNEVRLHTLLAPKQAPTPVPRSPLSSVDNNLPPNTVPRPKAIYKTDFDLFAEPSSDSSPTTSLSRSPSYDPETVVAFEPVPYWCGRFASLLDRHNTAAFHIRSEADTNRVETTEERRDKIMQILAELFACCEGEDAENSFQLFHASLQASQVRMSRGDEETVTSQIAWGDVVAFGQTCREKRIEQKLVREVEGNGERRRASKKSWKDGDSIGSMLLSVGRSAAIMDRLLGRGRKSAG